VEPLYLGLVGLANMRGPDAMLRLNWLHALGFYIWHEDYQVKRYRAYCAPLNSQYMQSVEIRQDLAALRERREKDMGATG
jgi:hypothetical protein